VAIAEAESIVESAQSLPNAPMYVWRA